MTTSIVSVSATQSALQVNGINSLVFNSAGDVQMASQNGGQLAGTRNAIINGDMRIDQRRGGAIFTQVDGAIADGYAADRWLFGVSGSSAGTGSRSIQQVADAPAGSGLQYSLKTTTNTALSSGRTNVLLQRVEGSNFYPMAGQTVTLSYWVKGSKAGNMSVRPASTTTPNVVMPITTAWTKNYITATASATALVDFNTGNGEQISFSFTDYVVAGDSVSISGIQLEKGPVATPFENRPVGMELALCQRFCQLIGSSMRITAAGVGNYLQSSATFLPMRSIPTAVLLGQSINNVNNVVFTVVNNYSSRLEALSVAAGDAYVLQRTDLLSAEL